MTTKTTGPTKSALRAARKLASCGSGFEGVRIEAAIIDQETGLPELLASHEELKKALHAAMRIIGPTDYLDAVLAEIKRAGIEDGIDVRADTAIAKAQGKEIAQ